MTTCTIVSPYDSTRHSFSCLKDAVDHAHKGYFLPCAIFIHHNGQRVAEKQMGSDRLIWMVDKRSIRQHR